MVIADIRATAIYEDALRTLGASNVERRRLGWRFWWGNPIASTTLLTASKLQSKFIGRVMSDRPSWNFSFARPEARISVDEAFSSTAPDGDCRSTGLW